MAADLRDALGWSLPFRDNDLDREVVAALAAADALEQDTDGLCKSRYRVSSVGEDLFLHSAYPTQAEDAVFFGPDSYRFAALLRRELANLPPRREGRLVDIGAGAGVGAIVAAKLCPHLRTTMTDINPKALFLASVNARAAGVEADFVLGEGLAGVTEPIDLAIANPPYIVDDAGRDYRDGGDMHGGEVALQMAEAAVERLARTGRMILYTGGSIVAGRDPLHDALRQLADGAGCDLRYDEIDPDVFGEELTKPAYHDVERIAVVAAVLARR